MLNIRNDTEFVLLDACDVREWWRQLAASARDAASSAGLLADLTCLPRRIAHTGRVRHSILAFRLVFALSQPLQVLFQFRLSLYSILSKSVHGYGHESVGI